VATVTNQQPPWSAAHITVAYANKVPAHDDNHIYGTGGGGDNGGGQVLTFGVAVSSPIDWWQRNGMSKLTTGGGRECCLVGFTSVVV
jgi:hypothetical protein